MRVLLPTTGTLKKILMVGHYFIRNKVTLIIQKLLRKLNLLLVIFSSSYTEMLLTGQVHVDWTQSDAKQMSRLVDLATRKALSSV